MGLLETYAIGNSTCIALQVQHVSRHTLQAASDLQLALLTACFHNPQQVCGLQVH